MKKSTEFTKHQQREISALRLVHAFGDCNTSFIALNANIPQRLARRAITTLQRKGFVQTASTGKAEDYSYKITMAGIDYLDANPNATDMWTGSNTQP